MRLRQKIMGAADTVKGFFGAKKNQDTAVEKLEALRVSPKKHNFNHPQASLHL